MACNITHGFSSDEDEELYETGVTKKRGTMGMKLGNVMVFPTKGVNPPSLLMFTIGWKFSAIRCDISWMLGKKTAQFYAKYPAHTMKLG